MLTIAHPKGVLALAIPISLMLGPQHAAAAVSVFTPVLQAGVSKAVCSVANTNPALVAVEIRIRDAKTGAILVRDHLALAENEIGSLKLAGAGYRYCEVRADSASLADRLRVGLSIRDGSGTDLSILRGRRTTTVAGNSLGTPALAAASNLALGFFPHTICRVLNTASTSQEVAIALCDELDPDCSPDIASAVTVPPGQSVQALATPGPLGLRLHCRALAGSASKAKHLRMSLYVRDSSVGDSLVSVDGN